MKTGKNFKIGDFNIIHPTVEFGNDVIVGNFCEINEGCKIGNNVIIQGYVRMAKGCIIEDDVTLKIGVILTSKVTLKKSAFMGPRSICLGGDHHRIVKHGTIIGENSYIGAAAQIMPNLKICRDITIGALSLVKKDIENDYGAVYAGIPAEKIIYSDDYGKCPRCMTTIMNNNSCMCPLSCICDTCSAEVEDNKKLGIYEVQCPDCFRFFRYKKEDGITSWTCPYCKCVFDDNCFSNQSEEEIKKELGME